MFGKDTTMARFAFSNPTRTSRARLGLAALFAAVAVLALWPIQQASAASAFRGQGMWIWYVKQAERGDVEKIVAKAKKYKVRTVYVKSSDGSSWWPQWDRYAAKLKAAGLKVCAWQYVYGSFPVVEADLAARAAASGADCIVVDA